MNDVIASLTHLLIDFWASLLFLFIIFAAFMLVLAALVDIYRKRSWAAVRGFFGMTAVSAMLVTICVVGLKGLYDLASQ